MASLLFRSLRGWQRGRAFFPRQAFYGATLLSLSLVGHIFIHAAVLHDPAAFLVFLLASTLIIAYFRRPSVDPKEAL
jgi:hypothetical protein